MKQALIHVDASEGKATAEQALSTSDLIRSRTYFSASRQRAPHLSVLLLLRLVDISCLTFLEKDRPLLSRPHPKMAFISGYSLHGKGASRFHNYTKQKSEQRGCRVCMSISRRACLKRILWSSIALSMQPTLVSNAAMYSADTASDFAPKGDPNKIQTYMPQIEAGYQALLDLQKNWEAKTKDYDGDVVRRVLGTVGVKSPLFNIRKPLLKSWQIISESSTDDALIERLETEWNDVINGIASVDFQLYSVSFTELTESKESLIVQGRKALDDTIAVYSDMLTDLRSAM